MSAVQTAAAPALTTDEPVSRRRRLRGGRVVLNLVLGLIGIFWLVPSIGLFITSFRPRNDYAVSGWWTVLTTPASLTLDNYRHLLTTGPVVDSLLTTLAITVPVTILVTVVASLAAYSLVFGRWKGRDAALILIVAFMVVPLQLALIPVAQLYNFLGIFGTIIGVVIFHTAFGLPFGIFLMRNFYTGIPRDLLEAGRIDGAGEWKLFRRVVMPLGLPAIASLAIFQFIWVWNDLLVALVFLGGSSHVPTTVLLLGQLRQFGANIDLISTAAFVSMLVPLAVFLSFQRYFVRGVLAGAVK
jgi:alpha-glucoside transport system permease protein